MLFFTNLIMLVMNNFTGEDSECKDLFYKWEQY